MKKGALALVVILGSLMPVQADSTTLTASPPKSSIVGQRVTFTASFYFACADGVTTHYFQIDGRTVPSTFAQHGQYAVDTLSISTLSVGRHAVRYYWQTSMPPGPSCGGDVTIAYTVNPKPAPAPTPSPRPVPTALASPSPVESPAGSPSPSPASPARLAGTTVADSSRSPELPLVAGIGVLVVLFVAGTLIWLRLRRRPGS